MDTFRAIVARQADGTFSAGIEELRRDELPKDEVLVRVAYSSLNYKDGLAVTGRPGVIRSFPMVPGIDLAGTVEESDWPGLRPGDQVVVTSCGTSETHWGGYAQYARLPASWAVKLPAGISLEQSMAIGTAGLTAMQCVMALEEQGMKPGGREVVVTGAAGGVGSVAVAILARRGYRVVASSGRAEQHEYLRRLGASEIIGREVLTSLKKPLESERWGGAIDTVGGDTLSGLLRTMAIGASVANCGLAGSSQFTSTVFPFILRGVKLIGIDAVHLTNPQRREIWARIAEETPFDKLARGVEVIPLAQVFDRGEQILRGQVRGRVVVDVNA